MEPTAQPIETKLDDDGRGDDDRDYVNSLARGLNVIRAFSRAQPSMTLSDVAKRTGINRAAARRFLLTLVREGYAETDGKYFRLRPKILELGFSTLSSMTFSQIAQPIMDDLTDSLEEMSLLAVLDGTSVVYVNRAAPRRVVSVDLDIGSRLPAFCMSTGRVLLAALGDEALDRWLDELEPVRYTERTVVSKRRLRELILQARADGWSIVAEEYELGFMSASAPVLDGTGATVAALNVGCPRSRVTMDDMHERILPATRRAAEAISAALPGDYLRPGRDLAAAPPRR